VKKEIKVEPVATLEIKLENDLIEIHHHHHQIPKPPLKRTISKLTQYMAEIKMYHQDIAEEVLLLLADRGRKEIENRDERIEKTDKYIFITAAVIYIFFL